MSTKRDTAKYELKKGNKVLYAGVTDNLERREAQHRNDKNFDKMVQVGRKTTRDAAEKWETDRLATYKKNQGDLPKYNKTETGK